MRPGRFGDLARFASSRAKGAPFHHIEWVLQRGFVTPDEWIGDEGVAYRKQYGMRNFTGAFKRDWAAFRDEHNSWSSYEIEKALTAEGAA